jgi:hypothetical protein
MIKTAKFGVTLLIIALGTIGIVLSLPNLIAAQSPIKNFRYNNLTYTVRVIQVTGNQRVIEIGVNAPTDSGDRSWTTYRQYSGSCGGSQYNFLGEHSTDRNGVVRFSNPQPPGTIIKTSQDAGRLVKRGFDTACPI